MPEPTLTNPQPKSFPALLVPIPDRQIKPVSGPAKPQAVAQPAALIPLFYAAILFLAGIVLAHDRYLRPTLLLTSLVPLTAVALLAIARAPRLNWLPIAAIWLVLGVWSAETEPLPTPDPAILSLSDGLLRTVEGTVVDAGPVRQRDADLEDSGDAGGTSDADPSETEIQRVDLQLASAEVVTDSQDSLIPIPAGQASRIRLSVLFPVATSGRKPILCGERLRTVVRILPAPTFRNAGVWSQAQWLESQGVTAVATVNAARQDQGQPRLTVFDGPSSALCQLNRWRDDAGERLQSLPALTRRLPEFLRASPEDAAMLTAMVTGDRAFLTRSLRAGFERTGSFHLIVISGLHLAILAGCVYGLARRLRLHRFAATGITLALTLAYALFTGFGLPAQRSFWMIALYLIGRLLYRNRSPLNVIGFATLALAAASPRSIFDASFQMTLLAVAGIAGVALPLLEHTLLPRIQATRDLSLISLDPKLPPQIAQFRVTLRLIARQLDPAANRWIAWQLFPWAVRSVFRLGELFLVALVVELALALPMAIYFHRITVYALPVNLCILPLLALLVPSAMVLLVVLAVWPAAAIVPAAICLAILHLSVGVVRGLGALSWADLRIPDPTAFQVALAIAFFLLALQLARAAGRLRQFSFLAVAATALIAIWPRAIDHPATALFFEAIDVGQGDALLLISPGGKSLLVDAGGLGFPGRPGSPLARFSGADFDIGEEVVSPVLWSRGIRRLDAVALTHAHNDHMGGLAAILRNFHPRELWVGDNPPVPAYAALLRQAQTLGVRARAFHAGDSTQFGDLSVRVLAPSTAYHPGREPSNNDSLVLQARYRATSILLAGDAEALEEQFLLSEPGIQSSVLKVGHHGSLTSTRPQFLEEVSPGWAVISCGRRNRFGHPRPEILAELETAHIRTLRTDTLGAACLILDGKAVHSLPLCSGP